MKYLRLFWLWLKLPLLYIKRPYKNILERENIVLRDFGYHLNVKQQRQGLQNLANKIQRNKNICLSALFKQKCYDVLATDTEDGNKEIKSEIKELITLSMYIYSCPHMNKVKNKNDIVSEKENTEAEKDIK